MGRYVFHKKTSRSIDALAATPLCRQRPTIYKWTACLTLTFALLSLNLCATHLFPMDCICATYEANRSNKLGATGRTLQTFERPMWSWSLTFWSENGAGRIVVSWTAFLPNKRRFGQMSTEPQSGHHRKFKRPLWPGPLTFFIWKVYSTSISRHECLLDVAG